MIDTLRFRIPIDISTYSHITGQCIRISRTSPEDGGFRLENYNKTLAIGLHRVKVRLTTGREDCIFIEFSVPKYFYGHNIWLFDPNDLPVVLDDLKNVIEDKFSVKLPDYTQWRVQRLDICYAWQFRSNEEAHQALTVFKPYMLPRKDQQVYDTTIKYKGFSSSTTFYLKHEEFRDNAYRELVLWGDGDFANKMLELSKGVLRFEVVMHKQKLDSVFKRDIYPHDIMDTEYIFTLLRQHLSDIIKTSNPEVYDLSKSSRLINSCSSPRKGWELWSFYRIFSSTNPVDQQMMKLLTRSTYYLKLKQLKELGVGILDQDTGLQFSFDIPSLNAVSNAEV
ncbi:hypothetical protein KJZ67_04365 [Patescibacteria group bacterium]|nr:hypothetical protein [Patescibacteria group bacterium]